MIADCGSRIADWGRFEFDRRFVVAKNAGVSLYALMTKTELKKRTFEFGIRVIKAGEALPRGDVPRTPGGQLLRAGASVGANYRAASRARSRAEFISKLGIVEEECDETACWLEVISELKLLRTTRLAALLKEART